MLHIDFRKVRVSYHEGFCLSRVEFDNGDAALAHINKLLDLAQAEDIVPHQLSGAKRRHSRVHIRVVTTAFPGFFGEVCIQLSQEL
jgi:hypothetical protein